MWGPATETLLSAGSTLDDILTEGFTKIIVGEESIDYFDTLVDTGRKLAGQKRQKRSMRPTETTKKVAYEKLKRQWQYHLMLLPGVILIFIFAYIPLYGVIIAFEDYNPALGFASPWVGMKHFQYIFSQPAFLRTIWNTFFIAVMKLIGGIVVPVIFALLLNELVSNRLKRIFQTLIYIPNFFLGSLWRAY